MVDIDPTHSPDPGDPDVDFEPEHDEPDLDESGDDPDEGEVGADAPTPAMGGGDMPPIPRPINWRTLSSDDAEHEWLALNEWVNWLLHEFMSKLKSRGRKKKNWLKNTVSCKP